MQQLLFHHVCIQTNCYEKSLAFYRDILGMTITDETENFHGRAYNTWLQSGRFRIELQTPKNGTGFLPFDKQSEGIAHLCFLVADVDKTYEALRKKGVDSFLLHGGQPVYEVLGGRLLKLKTPEGTILEFRDKEEN